MISVASWKARMNGGSPARDGVRPEGGARCVAGLAPVWLDADGAPRLPIEDRRPVRCLKPAGHAAPHESYMHEWSDDGPLPFPGGRVSRPPASSRGWVVGFVRVAVTAGSSTPLWPPETRSDADSRAVPKAPDLGPRPHAGCGLCSTSGFHVCYACSRCRGAGGETP